MEVIKLNLIPGKACPVVHVSQFDDGREFKAELYEGVNVYTLDGTEALTAIVKKPDGNEVTAAVTNTSDNYVIITTTEQMTACAGDNLGTLRIEKGAVTIATLNFILECQASPDTGIESQSEIDNLDTQVAAIVADQYDAADVIFDSTPTPGHGVGFAVTSEGVANAVDGAKQYTDDEISTLTIPENIGDLGDVTVTTPTNGEILVYNNGVFENQANPASTVNFAPDYDDTATYNTNDKVIYQGLYYIALEDSITGAWDPTKWALTTVSALTGETLPLTTNPADGTVSEAIGDLSDLTTTNKDSLVEAVNEVDGDISNLQTNKSNLLEYFTVAVSVPYGNARYKSVDVNIARSGYTALGVVGYNLTSIDNIVFACRMTSATTVSFGIQTRDGSNSSATISGYINVLYVKN